MNWRHRARLALRIAWRDLRAQPGRTALVLALVTISAVLVSTAGVATARALAPESTVGLSGTDHAAPTTLDPHVVTFLFVAAALGALLTVLLVVPVYLTGLRRRTRELALLAVAGARTSDLVIAVLLPAGLCGLLGSASGAAVGRLIGTAITSAPGDPSTAQVQWALMAAIAAGAVVLALSLGSALYPALLVARSPLVDVLAGRLTRGPRLPHGPRAIVGLGLVGTGAWAANRGAMEASAPSAVAGIVLAAGGGILLTSVVLGLVGQVRLRWSYAATFALRDAARHQIRILPGAAASAGGVTAVVAAMMYTGSLHAAEVASYHMAETGQPDLGTRETQYALLAAATAAIVILAWLMAALAAQESRADQATLQAVGAPPSFRSRVIGLQGGLTALFAVVGGLPSGLALGWLLLQIQRNQPMYTPGDATVTVPWLPVIVLAVGLPPLVALGTAILAPRDPVLTRRSAD